MTLKYSRVLLKFSGEALMGQNDFGLDANTLRQVVAEVKSLRDLGVEVGIVVGGGNVFRGAQLAGSGINRTTADQMGMLATVMNALALRDVIEAMDMQAKVYSAKAIEGVAISFDANQAKKDLNKGLVTIFAGGTGCPYFTTDSAAALRGIEIDADIVLKATKVDGIYTADPMKDSTASLYTELSFDEVISKNLQVMDMTAFILCKENNMPIRVFDMFKKNALIRIVKGKQEGTLVK